MKAAILLAGAALLSLPIIALAAQAQAPAPPAAAGAAPAAPAMPNLRAQITPVTPDDLMKKAGNDWLTYHGDYTGDHYSTLTQINAANLGSLKRAWVSQTNPVAAPAARAGAGLIAAAGRAAAPPPNIPPGETGVGGPGYPNNGIIASNSIIRNGVIFYGAGANAFAIDGKTGKQIWQYVGRAVAGLSNRGLAIYGDTLFMMGNGGLIALDAATGEERWTKAIDGRLPAYAPFVVKDHVMAVSGTDAGTARSFVQSFNAKTGESEWIFYAVPKAGEFGYNTWPDEETASRGSGTPWQAMTYDPDQNLMIFGTGNPAPIKDGRVRPGDNLYTDCLVAVNPDTGKLAWYFQATPHDDHDFDNNATISLADVTINGKRRKVATWTSRNGYQYTVDRTTGESLMTHKVLRQVNWALDKLRTNGTPEPNPVKSPSRGGALVNPSSEGLVNYPSQAYSPQTGLHYTNMVNAYSMFYWSGETFLGNFKDSLRASDPLTGKTVWQHDYREPNAAHARYPSVLATAGGLIFTGDASGNFVAFDARTGKILWHDELPDDDVSGVPESYAINGKQYIVVPEGAHMVAYAIGG